ncbi:YraN family protein [Amycolatopsis aidingensis]|uniref:YraN family protein n=1 Tax=Amycolatopsis aidingensis TaxID=2842453 RepID=UPI001C0D8351|nr:YraN family protein [Amycolatopsis aidingensis]
MAAAHLRGLGLWVLERNWSCRDGELDLLATDGHSLIVCEVKTRSSRSFGPPEESVTRTKSKRIRRLARLWLREQGIGWCRMRFDVISIETAEGTPRLRHIEGAF